MILNGKQIICKESDSGMEKYLCGANQGYILCPDVARFCKFFNENTCFNKCHGRGSCVDGHCHCDYGYFGNNCQYSPIEANITEEEPNECSVDTPCLLENQSCVNNICVCDYKYFGLDCTQTYEDECFCNEFQMSSDGVCVCKENQYGDDCSCSTDCSSQGKVCTEGNCICNPGYFGDDCSCTQECNEFQTCLSGNCVCLENQYGDDCSCQEDCTIQGKICVEGSCICTAGYFGDDCSCTQECNENQTCFNGDCVCLENYFGDDCSCTSDCSLQGICQEGGCICNLGYFGDDCSCSQECNEFSTCLNGDCVCLFNYYGDDCSCQEDCTLQGKICHEGICICAIDGYSSKYSYSSQCNAYSTCVDGACQCLANYFGDDCSCSEDCAQQDKSCIEGVCQCRAGYFGDDCSCLQECNDFQLCSNSFCICQGGYYGDDCRCTTDCLSQGKVCIGGSCLCEQDFLDYNDECVQTCPGGFYKDTLKGNNAQELQSFACSQCPQNCSVCSDEQTCLQCEQNYYLLNHSCVSSCPKNYSQTLSGENNLTCTMKCPLGYVNQDNTQCIDCPQVCDDNCSNKQECQNCMNSFYQTHKECQQALPQECQQTCSQIQQADSNGIGNGIIEFVETNTLNIAYAWIFILSLCLAFQCYSKYKTIQEYAKLKSSRQKGSTKKETQQSTMAMLENKSMISNQMHGIHESQMKLLEQIQFSKSNQQNQLSTAQKIIIPNKNDVKANIMHNELENNKIYPEMNVNEEHQNNKIYPKFDMKVDEENQQRNLKHKTELKINMNANTMPNEYNEQKTRRHKNDPEINMKVDLKNNKGNKNLDVKVQNMQEKEEESKYQLDEINIQKDNSKEEVQNNSIINEIQESTVQNENAEETLKNNSVIVMKNQIPQQVIVTMQNQIPEQDELLYSSGSLSSEQEKIQTNENNQDNLIQLG